MTEQFSFERVDHVQLAIPAGGEVECRAFWGGLLGLPEAPKPHPAFRIHGIRPLADRLAAAGYPVTWSDDVPGQDRFHCADPFGNRLEFLELH